MRAEINLAKNEKWLRYPLSRLALIEFTAIELQVKKKHKKNEWTTGASRNQSGQKKTTEWLRNDGGWPEINGGGMWVARRPPAPRARQQPTSGGRRPAPGARGSARRRRLASRRINHAPRQDNTTKPTRPPIRLTFRKSPSTSSKSIYRLDWKRKKN